MSKAYTTFWLWLQRRQRLGNVCRDMILLCACCLLEKRCTVGSWIVAVEAWTVAFVEGIKSYLSWSRLKLFDNKFYHCFSSSCSCIFNFRWSCNYIVTRARTARLNRNCLRGGYRSGTCGCLVFHWHWISFTWIICINVLLVCHYLKLQHVIRRPARWPPCPL